MPADFLTTMTRQLARNNLRLLCPVCPGGEGMGQQEPTVASPGVCIIGRQQERNVGTQMAPFF